MRMTFILALSMLVKDRGCKGPEFVYRPDNPNPWQPCRIISTFTLKNGVHAVLVECGPADPTLAIHPRWPLP
jgi:hypothetical protein